MHSKTWVWLVTALLLPMGCGSDDEDAPECPSGGTPLTYGTFGRDFFSTYCASCHAGSVTGAARQGAPMDVVFDTLPQIKARREEIVHQAVVQKTMPYGPASRKPTDTERQQLGEWLACGAAE